MADLDRQNKAQAQKEKEAADVARHRPEDEDDDGHPKNPAEDQRNYLEERRALEPHGIVTTTTPTDLSVQKTPSTTLYSPSSSESLVHQHRARALSFLPVDAGSSFTTMSKPPSSLLHQHTPSSPPPNNFLSENIPFHPVQASHIRLPITPVAYEIHSRKARSADWVCLPGQIVECAHSI